LGPCSSKPSLDLIFKAGIPLEEYLTLRRVKNESFSKEEI
jgi:regulatory protein YycH of two-component signal transduction system YycFG